MLSGGRLSIQLLFVLYGFIAVWTDESDGELDCRRICRDVCRRICAFYPLYLLGLFLDPRTWALCFNWNGAYLISTYVLLVQSWLPPFGADPPNGPGWVFSNLFAFWLTTPFWVQLLRRLTPTRLWVVLLGCWSFPLFLDGVALVFKYTFKPGEWHSLTLHQMVAFSPLGNWHFYLAGAAVGFMALRRKPMTWGNLRSLFAVTLVACFFFIGAISNTDHPLMLEKGFWSLPLWSCLGLTLVETNLTVSHILAVLAPLSILAIPIYILHVPIAELLRSATSYWPVAVTCLLQMVVIVAAAAVAYLLELSFRKIVSHWYPPSNIKASSFTSADAVPPSEAQVTVGEQAQAATSWK